MFILAIVCVKIQQFLLVVHVAPSKLVHLTPLPTTSKDDTLNDNVWVTFALSPAEI